MAEAKELCDEYDIDDDLRESLAFCLETKFNEESMADVYETLWDSLGQARKPGSVLAGKLRDMRDGSFKTLKAGLKDSVAK